MADTAGDGGRRMRWAPVLLLAAAGGAATLALSAAGVGPFPSPFGPHDSGARSPEDGADRFGPRDEDRARRLTRRRIRTADEASAADHGAVDTADGAAAREGAGTIDDDVTAPPLPEVLDGQAATFAGMALRAHLDVPDDVPDATARAVTPGRPPRVRLADFVSAGRDTLRGAVELIGDRTPKLEEGVPVAVTGRVLEEESGDPIGGATILVTSTFYVRQFQYDHHLREVARVESGPDGTFEIERLNADPAHFGDGGRVFVTVVHPGHATALAVPLADVTPGFANRLPDIVLTRETHTLRGRIVDHWKKEPIAGARVVATGAINPISYPKDQRAALFLAASETVTDDEGRFELTGLRAGRQHVSLHAGDDCIANDAFTVPQDDEIQMRGHPIRGRIEGRIVNADDEAVPLAVVFGGSNSSHSFADGGFVLENFSGEVVELVVSHPEYRELRVKQVADDRTGLELRLERRVPLVRLDVRAQDSEEPLRHVEVVLVPRETATPRVTKSPHFLAASGVHEIRLPEGVARLTIVAPGHAAEEIDASGLRDGDAVRVLLRPTE